MRKYSLIIALIFLTVFANCGFCFPKFGKNKQTQTPVQTQTPQNSQKSVSNQNSQTTYPDDVDAEEISEEEYTKNIDIEQAYRDTPIADFKYIHNIDPGEYQDTMHSTWSPYPLFRLTSPLYFKSVAIEPGYYLLTPREHEGKWYILFKEGGRVKYIIPCYNREMVPMDFYKNNLPQIKMTPAQKIREKTLIFVGKHFKSSMREPTPDTYLDANDMDNNFISIIVYWGNYRYYMVLRTIQL